MVNPVLADLQVAVDRAKGAQNSAVVLLTGIAVRIQTAVDAALANGATATELQPVVDEVAALNVSTDALAAAVATNP